MIEYASLLTGAIVGASVGAVAMGLMKARQLTDTLADLEFIRGVAAKRHERINALIDHNLALENDLIAAKLKLARIIKPLMAANAKRKADAEAREASERALRDQRHAEMRQAAEVI